MTWFPDLGTESMMARGPNIRAVGWLSSSKPFPKGTSSAPFVAKLRERCANWGTCRRVLNWSAAGGRHTCEMCDAHHASGNLGIPASGLLYVAPEMIAHYVEAHDYLPPQEFIDAMLACPSPDTSEYESAVSPFVQRTPSDES
jgi:hypothetical protein